MIIQVDDEGKNAVSQLCEIATRYAGIQLSQGGVKSMQANAQSLQGIAAILRCVQLIPKKDPLKPEEPKKKK